MKEKHSIVFCRVLYFPNRGPPKHAEGTLQEEVKVVYEFLGEDIFNIMVIITTNQKEHQKNGFTEEDISTTTRAFTRAYKRVTGFSLRRCPPILYLPFHETATYIGED